MKSSLEIAQEAVLEPIEEIGAKLGLEPDELEPYGRYKGKIELSVLDRLADRPVGCSHVDRAQVDQRLISHRETITRSE